MNSLLALKVLRAVSLYYHNYAHPKVLRLLIVFRLDALLIAVCCASVRQGCAEQNPHLALNYVCHGEVLGFCSFSGIMCFSYLWVRNSAIDAIQYAVRGL